MTERVSRVLSLAVTLSLWAGGLVAGIGILRPLLAGGTATGLQSREVMTGGRAALRIGLADVGDVRTRLLVRVPRSLDGVATFTAHMADDSKPLKVVARAIEPEGRWLEIRSHADSSQGHFLWPAQAELELQPRGGGTGPLRIIDWIVVLEDRPADRQDLARRRTITTVITATLVLLGAVGTLVTGLRSSAPPESKQIVRKPVPPPPLIDGCPRQYLEPLVRALTGETERETRLLQEFVERRLAGEDYEEIMERLEIDRRLWRERTIPWRAQKQFLSRVRTCSDQLAYARSRFADAPPRHPGGEE